ncbi:hypothetical protein DXG03_006361 [Asterophora parasitica]|uniref:Uncharacterized protein n=1 Tax=Asterophora parasitica TaxID=117018 RepID=A0A9P7G1E8_9AGAR|nr:hypothetical protein DXG03_006361 [Asterophora parasitica]
MSLPSTLRTPRSNHGQPCSPLGHKHFRLASGNANPSFIPYTLPIPLPSTPYHFISDLNIVVDTNSLPSVPVDHIEHSKKMLQADAHDKQRAYTAKEQEDKGTKVAYLRHVRAYQMWWDDVYQPHTVSDDPSRAALLAFPITAAKVMMFLDYEVSCPKHKKGSKNETVPGSFVGRSHLKQAISALKNHRLNNQSDYLNEPDAQHALQSVERIKKFEDSISHDEPKRVEKSQALKAAGTIADTYTKEQLIQMSAWCLTDFTGP